MWKPNANPLDFEVKIMCHIVAFSREGIWIFGQLWTIIFGITKSLLRWNLIFFKAVKIFCTVSVGAASIEIVFFFEPKAIQKVTPRMLKFRILGQYRNDQLRHPPPKSAAPGARPCRHTRRSRSLRQSDIAGHGGVGGGRYGEFPSAFPVS
jgi:hypothetical protein